jgi:hypothetical protein
VQGRARVTIVAVLAAGAVGGTGACSAVLGIDSDRHVVSVATDAALDTGAPDLQDAGGWWCENDPVPDAAAGPFKVSMFVDDVSSASSQNSFAGNPIPGASVLACSTLDLSCADPVDQASTNDAGIALLTVPSGFSGYYQLTASGFTSAIAARTPQLGDESVQQGMADLQLIAEGGGLAGVTQDPTLATAIVSILDCNETPAAGMVFSVGAPGPKEKLVYLVHSLPSGSATQTDATGSAIIYNASPGTLELTGSFASDGRVVRSMTTLVRVGWVTFVQMRLDQTTREPLPSP